MVMVNPQTNKMMFRVAQYLVPIAELVRMTVCCTLRLLVRDPAIVTNGAQSSAGRRPLREGPTIWRVCQSKGLQHLGPRGAEEMQRLLAVTAASRVGSLRVSVKFAPESRVKR